MLDAKAALLSARVLSSFIVKVIPESETFWALSLLCSQRKGICSRFLPSEMAKESMEQVHL